MLVIMTNWYYAPMPSPMSDAQLLHVHPVCFFDQPQRITTVCNLEIVPNKSVPPQIIEPSPGTYLVSSPNNRFSIVCPDTSISYFEPCNMCQIHVKCICTLNVGHLKDTCPLDRCHLPLPAIQVKHGINMALMNHFKLSSPPTCWWQLSVSPPNTPTSPQHIPQHSKTSLTTKNNLNQVVEVIKEEHDTYRKINLTATETFLNKLPFSNNDSFFTMWQYISIFVITGVIISHFILVFRVRKLFALIVSSSMVHTVESAELLTHLHTSISRTPPVDVHPFYSYYNLIAIITAAGSIFAFIRFLHFIGQIMSHFPRTMQYFRLCSGPTPKLYKSRLYVKIYGETDRVLLSLTSLETEPNLLSFGISPTITRISHKHIKYRPFLQLTWTGDLNYFVYDLQQMTSLPTLIPIPFSLRCTVKNIVSATQLPKCVIIAKYRNADNLIEIPTIFIDINNPPLNRRNPPRSIFMAARRP